MKSRKLELHRLPSDHSNPMIWIAGHVLNSRADLARYLKIEAHCPWSELFERHSQLQPAAAYPDVEEILGVLEYDQPGPANWERSVEPRRVVGTES